jgi:C4-dicarboxylate-specific signal transduction histidine kinase
MMDDCTPPQIMRNRQYYYACRGTLAMTMIAPFTAMQTSAAQSARRAKRCRLPLRRDLPRQWLTGMGAIVSAALLFLACALGLGAMLSHLRNQMQVVERIQTIVLETRVIEDDLADAHNAVRGRADLAILAAEGSQAARRLTALMQIAPEHAIQLGSIAKLVEQELAVLARGGSNESASRALAAFRNKHNAAYAEFRNDADRDMVLLIAFTLVMALVGPGLGLAGVTLLQRDRESRRLREMTSELMHVQRQAVMGETAAMLAHEVSHPLAAASNYLAAMRRSAAGGDCVKAAELSDRAVQQIHRAATILGRLRRFIEKRDDERIAVGPAVLIQDAIALVGPLDSDISFASEVDPALPDVAIDRVQIQQVLVNLIRNAIDAMQGSPIRRLSISARAAGENAVEFSLADTGPGLSPEIAANLFQPFVSTKKNGMGVGLSICRSIIASHQGRIWAEPNPQGGAIFRFRLPVA